ncbi:hypothetical protein JST97_06060 [bacterium]|nr:hypothetical protein [bacterium]
MRHRRAYSLAELMVTCFLLGLATTLIFGLWDYGRRLFMMNQTESDAQRQALKFLHTFSRETLEAPWTSFTTAYQSGNPAQADLAVSFLTDRDGTGSVQFDPVTYHPQYQAWIVYFFQPSSGSVRRFRQDLASPSLDSTALSNPQLLNFIGAAPSTGIIANVLGWQALDYDSGLVTMQSQNPARYAVTVQQTKKQTTTIEFRTQMIH